MHWSVRNVHLYFLVVKYTALSTLGWSVKGVIQGPYFVATGLVLFVLFDFCALTLWWMLKRSRYEHTIAQQLVFYVIQAIAIVCLWISVFNPSLVANPVNELMGNLLGAPLF